MLTYIDQLKCNKFLEDPDKYFRKTKVISFDIIYKMITDKKIPDETLKDYQTAKAERTKTYSKKIKIGFHLLRLGQIEKIFIFKKR